MSKLLLALVEWQEEGFPLGVINLRAIEDPRLPFEDYRVGLDVYAKCQGFPGSHPAKILKIGESGIICEQKTHTISCSSGLGIRMTEANFGRTSKEKCRHPYNLERLHNATDCKSPHSLGVMQKLCDGRQSCTVTVENEMFGADPCHGIYKYLEFDFKCVSAKEVNSSQRNEGGLLFMIVLLLTWKAFGIS